MVLLLGGTAVGLWLDSPKRASSRTDLSRFGTNVKPNP